MTRVNRAVLASLLVCFVMSGAGPGVAPVFAQQRGEGTTQTGTSARAEVEARSERERRSKRALRAELRDDEGDVQRLRQLASLIHRALKKKNPTGLRTINSRVSSVLKQEISEREREIKSGRVDRAQGERDRVRLASLMRRFRVVDSKYSKAATRRKRDIVHELLRMNQHEVRRARRALGVKEPATGKKRRKRRVRRR